MYRGPGRGFLRKVKRSCTCALLSYRSRPPPAPPLEGFPFQIGKLEAVERFERFCTEKGVSEGLGISNLLKGRPPASYGSVTPSFVPLWCFDAEVRTVRGRTIYKQRRTGFSPDGMVYGGYKFHRHLLQGILPPLHGAAPFDSKWLLERMVGDPIFLDAWSVYRGTAWDVVRRQIREVEVASVRESWGASAPYEMQCQFVLHSARRMLLPVFVFQYDFFGSEFHVFVSGLERGPEASGIDHGNMFSSLSGGLEELRGQVEARLQQVRAGLARAPVDAHILNRFIVGLVASGLQITFNVGRVLVTRFPLLWPVALTGFVFFRKVFAPLRASRLSWEEWVEHAREETESQQRKGDTWTWSDDFVYEEKKWSQEDERRRQQQQQAKHRTQAQQNKARHSFDHMTPYQILGVAQNASESDIKAAFRRQLFLYHPDMQAGKTDEEKAYALARSQAITQAYRALRGKS